MRCARYGRRTTVEPDDLEAWKPQEPPPGFAERVVGEVRREEDRARSRRRSRRAGIATAAVLAMAATAVLVITPARRLTTPSSANASGSAIAADRIEIPLGARAIAVLEPGAEVKWNGDDIDQLHGNVFYRVEPGAKFRVHTRAGDVTVKGTCFRVKVREESEMNARDLKVGAVGVAIGALALLHI